MSFINQKLDSILNWGSQVEFNEETINKVVNKLKDPNKELAIVGAIIYKASGGRSSKWKYQMSN